MKIELKRTDAMRLLLACTHAGNSANDENSVNLWQRIHDEIQRQIDEFDSEQQTEAEAEAADKYNRKYSIDNLASRIRGFECVCSIFAEFGANASRDSATDFERLTFALFEIRETVSALREIADVLDGFDSPKESSGLATPARTMF